jgi:hypothetical protein
VSRLSFYEPNDIHLVWDGVKPHIETALERGGVGTHTLGDVAEGLISGSMKLWTYGDCEAALVSQIVGDACIIITLGGSRLKDYFHYLDVIEQWAKDEGCKEMQVYGRRGWARILPDYKEKYTALAKQL